MHKRDNSYDLNENWRVTKFVQAPNLAAYMFSFAVLPTGIYERVSFFFFKIFFINIKN